MIDVVQYILSEVKNKRLAKAEAIELIRQFQTQTISNQPYIIHPLLHQNTSNLSEQRFSSIFTGQEYFMADHEVPGKRTLSGLVCLEMVRAAVEQAVGIMKNGCTTIYLKNVVWFMPIIVGKQPLQIHIGLYIDDNGEIIYEIYSEHEGDSAERIVHIQGIAAWSNLSQVPKVDINALQMNAGPNSLLVKLSLPSDVSDMHDFVLHPSIMESALRVPIGLPLGAGGPLKKLFPLAMQEAVIMGSCTPTMWAVVRYSDGKFDIDLYDETGMMCVRMTRLEMQEYEEVRQEAILVDNPPVENKTHIGSGRGRRPEMKGFTIEQCLEWDLKEQISKILVISKDKLDRDENLAGFGFDSISLSKFALNLTCHFGIEITPSLFFGHSTIEKLIQYLLAGHQEVIRTFYRENDKEQVISARVSATAVKSKGKRSRKTRIAVGNVSQSESEPIAIIGMSGRFPEARNIDEMWAILAEGQDVVKEILEDRFDWRKYHGDSLKEPGKVNCRWCGSIPGVSEFDPLFFEISPREAETMDPRQRLLLQESWKALEDAGYGAKKIKSGKIGMFVGVEQGDYQLLTGGEGGITSNNNAILASRLAYFLNLSGPVMAIDTACSSALVAAHQACLSLRSRECDTAIAAGVNLILTPLAYIGMSQAGMLSEDGKCFAFDKRANGTIPGEAVAVVVLKRLSQAKADGDRIYALIKGSGINYDGKTNGITAPSGVSQTNLLKSVYDQYKINPEDIEYIITHGTGTKLGDPIEINALYDAFQGYTKKQCYCAITSTKTNFGHTLGVSGLVSLISLVQALRYEKIPASLHCTDENDYINWQESPFYVNKTSKLWSSKDGKARIGAVSAFGLSGTNAHMVVESCSEEEDGASIDQAPYFLLAFSAKTQEALQEKIGEMIDELQKNDCQEQSLSRISYTLLEGRQHFRNRCAIVIQDLDDAVHVLKQIRGNGKLPNLFEGKVARGFKGQTAIQQYIQDMLQEIRFCDKNRYQEILYALADLYCQGYEIDWEQLFSDPRPRIIGLPTYPFARERYWVSNEEPEFINPNCQNTSNSVKQSSSIENIMLHPYWREQSVTEKDSVYDYSQHLVILCESTKVYKESIENCMNGVRCLIVESERKGIGDRFRDYVEQVFTEMQNILGSKLKDKVLVQVLVSIQEEEQLFSGLAGILKTARFENPKLVGQLIEVEPTGGSEGVIANLKENSRTPADIEIRYQDGKRYVVSLGEIDVPLLEGVTPWKDQGIYLITGGAGGLGLIFAKEITRKAKDVVLILTGRSALDKYKQAQLKELEVAGAWIEYRQVDITQKQAVVKLMQSIREDYGNLNGIIHSAGIIRDNFIIKKTVTELQEVLSPKVTGLVNLDEASREMPLDFFICFSSMSGVMGNFGQADYSTANAFMDEYAKYRNNLGTSKQRHGHTLSINWPLWKEGGMHVDEETEKMLRQTIGMIPMKTETGIRALYEGFATGKSQVMVIEGKLDLIKEKLLFSTISVSSEREKVPLTPHVTGIDTGSLLNKIQAFLTQFVSKLLKVKEVDIDVEFNEYGFDSILFKQFTSKLNQEYKLDLVPTIFFEYPTLHSFSEYLVEEHRDVFATHFAANFAAQTKVEIPVTTVNVETMEQKRTALPASTPGTSSNEPIAIIGMSGIFPMAKDVNEFWENLIDGKDCITQIPKDRWDWHEYFGDPKTEVNKTNIKWGGFIDGVDVFDPLFFGISPREAELMDPQQRLMMTYIWKVIEDAGYSAASLSGTKTGIFVGTMSSGYSELIRQANIALEGYSSTGIVPSVGPNRMSYFLNIHGPSEPIETACSSSLVAIHRAISAIRDGSCEMAIVGGVNTILTPEAYISLSKAGMLCEDGRCKTFSNKANGYVRGEGVGMLFLKKLKDAEEAGDHIYGLVRGSNENHGGRANSLTSPNPKAQAELLKTAYINAGIDPRTVTYIEAHGSGTELGDPIEINALKTAFKELYHATGDPRVTVTHCGLGSVKTNIGHLEVSAGIAGVIKVLLQLKHQTLVKSLYCDTINPYIQLKDSPFYIVQENSEWKRLQDSQGQEIPRRAGVSSFGFGGVNAHLVIEEYIPPNQKRVPITSTPQNPAIIVISAKDEERLKEQVQQLLGAIQKQQFSDPALGDMAYTLQVGREPMEERLAMIVESITELEEKLKSFIEGQDIIQDLYRGQVKHNKETLAVFTDEELQEAIIKWVQRGKYNKLLDLWVKGLSFDWTNLYGDNKPCRISIPTYPFAKERCWVDNINTNSVNNSAATSAAAVCIHPLLHQNTSNLAEQRFSSVFTGKEFFLTDHKVNGQRVLPGVAYLEMARTAVEHAVEGLKGSQTGICLKNVVWARPITVGSQPVKVHIRLFSENNGQITYEIYTDSEANVPESVVHSQGVAVLSAMGKAQVLDLPAIQAQCSQSIISSGQCYEAFNAVGIDYGPGHQGIEAVYVGQGQVLAKLHLPSSVTDTQNQFVLHPSLMDSALQAALGLSIHVSDVRSFDSTTIRELPLPFALQELEIVNKCTPVMWALIRYSEGGKAGDKVEKLDIDLCDDTGTVCVRIKGFSTRVMAGEIQTCDVPEAVAFEIAGEPLGGTFTLAPVWEPIPVEKGHMFPAQTDQVMIIGGTKHDRSAVQQMYPQAQILIIKADDTIDKIINKLEGRDPINHIVWIAPCSSLESLTENKLIEEQNHGVLQVFRIIKALLSLGYGGKNLGWSVITSQAQPINKNDRVNPTHASIHGLIGSMAKEYPSWKVRIIDLESDCIWPITKIFTLPTDSQGNAWVYRGREWYRQKLVSFDYPLIGTTLYKTGGVYVVIGGAGGIGEAWTEYMIRTYQAQVIWIGRRAKDDKIQTKLEKLAAIGTAPQYIAADATDSKALQQAYEEIRERYTEINGLVHSAIILLDQSLMNMSEERFRAGISAKIDVSVCMAQVFQKEPLDFVLFFSSMTSFTKSPGQSNYAAGCAFKDAFAHRLSQEWPCAVKVMNWGYWGSVGVVASKDYQDRMARSGIDSIEPPEAMDALETLFAGPLNQIALMKTTTPQIMEGMNLEELIAVYPEKIPSYIQNIQNHISTTYRVGTKTSILIDKVKATLIQSVSELLKVAAENIDAGAELIDYGLDQFKLSELVTRINQEFKLELTPFVFNEYQTICSFAKHLAEAYPDLLITALTDINQPVSADMNGYMKEMEKHLCRLLWGQLYSMGLFDKKNSIITDLKTKIGPRYLYDRWLEESIAVLARNNYLTYDGEICTVMDSLPVDTDVLWNEWDSEKVVWLTDSNMKAQVALVEVMLRKLPEILTGKVPATDIMFPNSSMALVEGVYKNNRVADFFNEVVADTVVSYVQERIKQDPSAQIRILEIGAGTGGTSARVLLKLKPYKDYVQEYCYTDISKAFLIHAEKEYGPENPHLACKIFNVEKSIVGQDIAAGGYDIGIATNVLHATKNIRKALRNTKAALKKNGVIIANEMSSNALFTHLTFGLLEGWWLYEDPALRIPGCPGLYSASWQTVLESEGFRPVIFPVKEAHDMGQQIIVAESDGVIWQKQQIKPSVKPVKQSIRTNTSLSGLKSMVQKPIQSFIDVTDQMVEDHVRTIIRESIAEALKMVDDRIQDDRSFSDFGVDSIIAINLVNLINKQFHITLQTTVLFDYNNVDQLSKHIIKEHKSTLVSLLKEKIQDLKQTDIESQENVLSQEHVLPETINESHISAGDFVSRSYHRKRFQPGNEKSYSTSMMGSHLTYHRVVIERPGGIDDVRLVESSVEKINEDEVRIAIRAFSLNFGDLLCVKGLYPSMPPYPFTPGFEASGIVVEVGNRVTSVKPGDEVIVVTGKSLGGQATLITCPVGQVFPKPQQLNFEEACALPAVTLTMIDAFRKAQIKKGEKILIQTAAGGTGLIALQLAKYYGAEIYATAGSDHKLAYLKKLGVSHLINYQETDFEKEIKRLTHGQGVDVVINTLSGDAIQKGFNCLSPGGRYIEIAMTGLKSAKSIDLSVLSNNQTFYSIDLMKLGLKDPEKIKEYMSEMIHLVQSGTINSTIHQSFPLNNFKDAYRAMENRKNIGKIVVSIPEGYQFTDMTDFKVKNPVPVTEKEPIAIIGMSGRFAKSKTVNELWNNLSKGVNLVGEVSRWNLSKYYAENKNHCNFGSFLDDIDLFDPLFFNIAGLEATYMDPQQRIFLEQSWKALEDAGYAGSGVEGRLCGVYVGYGGGDYQQLFGDDIPAQAFWGNSGSLVPARIAYYLDLHGPAIAVDTACSSSLVAIHLACQGLWAGETEMALAGGVFVQSTPAFYLHCIRAGMLSPTGCCYTFDDRADGFVPGEGVGVVILKRLKDAVADGDHIYGVIRGSGINQDGATNGITAPSAISQERLESSVYDAFNINPEQIQMVEAHGTGTKLGDPIEYQALTRTFKKYTDKKEYCALGSIKTNLGHAATAAGVAGVIKILLSLKNKQIPPSLNYQSGNSNILFEGSPFYVNTSLRDWNVEANSKRCAAISSFGFSGTNAHLVIEEAPCVQRRHLERPGYLIVLSARTSEQLRQQASQLVEHCEQEPETDCGNMSYTLLLGRKHFIHRLACVIRSQHELVTVLKKWLEKGKVSRVFVSEVHEQDYREQPSIKQLGNQCIQNCRRTENPSEYLDQLSTVADLYVQGYRLEFEELFSKEYSRIPLPTYPFSKERYWVSDNDSKSIGNIAVKTALPVFVHPLVQQNTSDFSEQRFSSSFTGQEFFLADHIIKGRRILPAVAYLEMARAAVEQAAGAFQEENTGIRFRNMVWAQPITVGGLPVQVDIALIPEDNGEIAFKIHSQSAGDNSGAALYSQGSAVLRPHVTAPVLDIETLKAQCSQGSFSAEQLYEALNLMGLGYGPAMRGVEQLYVGIDQVLAKLSLPSVVSTTQDQFVIHPSLMDSALQASLGLTLDLANAEIVVSSKISLPFALDRLEVFSKCSPIMWALVRYSEGSKAECPTQKLDVYLCDEQGKVCVQMNGFSSRVLEGEFGTNYGLNEFSSCTSQEPLVGTVMLTSIWDSIQPEGDRHFPSVTQRVLIIGGDKGRRDGILQQYSQADVLEILPSNSIEEIASTIQNRGTVEHVIWIAPYNCLESLADNSLITTQSQGVLQLFRIIKAMLGLGYGAREIGWTVITEQAQAIHKNDEVNPANASLHGLVGSMAKEYPNWKVRLVDVEYGCAWPFVDIFTLPADPQGNAWAYRGQDWYRQKLIPVYSTTFERTLYKPEGVYVVIGGAGGIGEVWSEYMIRNYNARIIWIGRREKDAVIQEKIERLAALGSTPHYITADATNGKDLYQAYKVIKKRYSVINGVIHSAIVLLDQSLENMEEERFKAGLSAKVDVSVRLAQVFQKEPLDFVVFFSSAISYGKPAGQSNYASGCTFKDAFGHQLAHEWPCTVKIMNWGYWGSVGVVASKTYQDRMAEAGFGSIEPPEAMEALDTLLAGPVDQLVFMKTTKPLTIDGMVSEEFITFYPESMPYMAQSIQKHIPQDSQICSNKSDIVLRMAEIDQFLCRLLLSQLQSVGIFTNNKASLTELKKQNRLCDLYYRWLVESLEVLMRNNYIKFDGESYSIIDETSRDNNTVWNEWNRRKAVGLEDPNMKAQITLVETMLRALPEILIGKVAATDVMFPNSSMELVEGIYKNNPVADYFNEVVADIVVTYVQERIKQDPSAQIRIIEIGAGTGGTSAAVLQKLKSYQQHVQEYCYTDISKAFLIHAEKEYGPENPYLTYEIFNVEMPVAQQVINAGGYDIAIAANVLHATKNIRQTVRNTKAVLRNGGLILLNEISSNFLVTHLTFGLLEGWWLYEDSELRIPGCPALRPEIWQKVLEIEGFRSVFFPVQGLHELGQQIIVGESDGVVLQRQKHNMTENATNQSFNGKSLKKQSSSQNPRITDARQVSRDLIKEKCTAYIKKIVGDTLKISVNKIDSSIPLGKYGMDSILVVQLTNTLSKVLDNVSSTLFYEYPTVNALVEHFMENQKDSMIALAGLEKQPLNEESSIDEEALVEPKPHAFTFGKSGRFKQLNNPEINKSQFKSSGVQDIAIIGLAGRYPGASNITEFWENLREGRDCITEIPNDRWDNTLYYDVDKNKSGTSYCKWGGFIKDVDKFDPLFFNISPREAELMDPQERLFLETVWNLFEDVGYTKETLQDVYQGMVGVFAGSMYQHYQHYNSDIIYESIMSLSSYSSIANRVSYFFNLQGPSIAIDTACSSSTIAIHMACESLLKGECRLAVAGGVNLSIHPKKYLGLCQGQMVGSHPNSRSFGDGDGFLPAEGVGAVLLKPLSEAIRDGDTILAVIKSTAINHGGQSNGYNVPNPNAQTKLIESNFIKSGIDPRTISYVESAANGSALGDPIEVNALIKVFEKFTSDRQFCAIGSVKSNIGHAEAASGISQLAKVILQLRHKKLVSTIKIDPLNPKLSFDNSPFYLQKELSEWERPVIKVDGEEREFPRRASISSFGAGGSNAHLIIEEYVPQNDETNVNGSLNSPQVAVFSARNINRLQAVVKNMLEFIENQQYFSLSNFAYSLQTRREAMEWRLAMVVNNREELIQGLREYLNFAGEGQTVESPIPIFAGNSEEEYSGITSFLSGKAEETVVQMFIAEKRLEKLAYYWVKGGKVPWEKLHEGEAIFRMSLPGYPFERKRYWITQASVKQPIMRDKEHTLLEQENVLLESDSLNGHIMRRIGELLGLSVEEIPVRKSLISLGFSSIQAVTLRYRLEQDFGIEIPMGFVSEHKTIEHLENKLKEILKTNTAQPIQKSRSETSKILPVIKSDSANRYQPFSLNDIQQSFLTGRKLRFGGDWVGCHIYLEIETQDLDIYRFNKAWERLINYHEMLRAVISSDGKQRILEKTPLYKFKKADLRQMTDRERSVYLGDIQKHMSHKVYEPEQWPLFEIRVSICPDKHVIHFSIDEFIIDASGISMLLDQWQQLYEKPDLNLPELEVSFRDYILAVKEFEKSNRYKRDMDYWTGKLENIPEGPRLISGRKSNKPENKDDYYRTRLKGTLGEKQWYSLKKKALKLKVSATTLLLTIFAEVLRGWSGQETFSLILTYFNRLPLHHQLDQLLGPFISTNIFVTEERRGCCLEEIVRCNQEHLWDDLDHSSVSGISVLRELKSRHKISGSLYLPVVFTSLINNLKSERTDDHDLFKQISFMVTQTPQVYLDHQVFEKDGRLEFNWDVAEGYFESDVIRGIFADYCRALHLLSAEDGQWNLENLALEAKFKKEAAAASQEIEGLPVGLELESRQTDRFKPFPLTDQQQAYAFGRHLAGGNNSCQIYHEIEVEELDIERLKKAWQKLIKNHEMLTVVIQRQGAQKILEDIPNFEIRVTDLTGKTAEEVTVELSTTKQLMVEHVFELDKWPYFDLRVSIVNSAKSIIHLSIDMLIADGHSILLLLNQLYYLYENPDNDLKKANISFREYILSLQKYKTTEGYQKSIQYWAKKFAGIPSGPKLPIIKQSEVLTERAQFKGVIRNWESLKKTAWKLSVQPSMILLTAYMEVFAAWLDYAPFTIVVPCWQRLPLHPDINDVVGDFTVMSWVSFKREKKTFEEKVVLNNAVVQEDLLHKAVSGLKALRKAVMRGGYKEMLSFPVVFSDMLTNITVKTPKGFRNSKMLSKTPKVYVDNISEDHNGELQFHWDVAKGVYPDGLIEEMFAGYQRLLDNLADNPESWQATDFSLLINATPEKYRDSLNGDGRIV